MFHIEWAQSAVAHLAASFASADTRLKLEIIGSLLEIRRQLTEEPGKAGESREPGTRVLVLYPLAVTFRVNVRTRAVLISGLHVYHREKE